MLTLLARRHARPLSFTYLLTSLGHLAELAYPFATGLAINGVLTGNYLALGWLIGCHLLQMVLTVASKLIDTRIFTHIYGKFASDIVSAAHAAGVDRNVIVARAALSREYVTFFEEEVPRLLYAVAALLVSLSALFWYDATIGFFCLLLFLPLLAIGNWLAKRSRVLNEGLNNRLEMEVGLLQGYHPARIARHYKALGFWRIKLSDAEARAFGLMEMTVIVLFAAALWRVGDMPRIQAGDVYAIFSYIWRFVSSLDQVPQLIQRLAKLKDLDVRFATDISPETP
jgi:hypothetical protein